MSTGSASNTSQPLVISGWFYNTHISYHNTPLPDGNEQQVYEYPNEITLDGTTIDVINRVPAIVSSSIEYCPPRDFVRNDNTITLLGGHAWRSYKIQTPLQARQTDCPTCREKILETYKQTKITYKPIVLQGQTQQEAQATQAVASAYFKLFKTQPPETEAEIKLKDWESIAGIIIRNGSKEAEELEEAVRQCGIHLQSVYTLARPLHRQIDTIILDRWRPVVSSIPFKIIATPFNIVHWVVASVFIIPDKIFNFAYSSRYTVLVLLIILGLGIWMATYFLRPYLEIHLVAHMPKGAAHVLSSIIFLFSSPIAGVAAIFVAVLVRKIVSVSARALTPSYTPRQLWSEGAFVQWTRRDSLV